MVLFGFVFLNVPLSKPSVFSVSELNIVYTKHGHKNLFIFFKISFNYVQQCVAHVVHSLQTSCSHSFDSRPLAILQCSHESWNDKQLQAYSEYTLWLKVRQRGTIAVNRHRVRSTERKRCYLAGLSLPVISCGCGSLAERLRLWRMVWKMYILIRCTEPRPTRRVQACAWQKKKKQIKSRLLIWNKLMTGGKKSRRLRK